VLAVIPHIPREEKHERKVQFKRRLKLLRANPALIFRPRKGVGHEDRLALHAHYAPNSIVAEAYRILRTNLKVSPERKVILVTSSGPGEGKTTVLSNLGIVIAQGGVRTMLVASDLRRPEVDRAFGLSRDDPGLAEVLRGATPLERVIKGLSDFILGKFGYDEAVKNPYLEKVLDEKGKNTEAVWSSILKNEGSVQHLEFLSEDEKAVFKTAFEIDQRWIIELAADRTPLICQSQSLNIFLPGDVDKWDLHMLHWMAWERGVKSLYYCRSKSLQRAGFAGEEAKAETADTFKAPEDRTDYEECLACQ
jgi:hypothetical protein